MTIFFYIYIDTTDPVLLIRNNELMSLKIMINIHKQFMLKNFSNSWQLFPDKTFKCKLIIT